MRNQSANHNQNKAQLKDGRRSANTNGTTQIHGLAHRCAGELMKAAESPLETTECEVKVESRADLRGESSDSDPPGSPQLHSDCWITLTPAFSKCNFLNFPPLCLKKYLNPVFVFLSSVPCSDKKSNSLTFSFFTLPF